MLIDSGANAEVNSDMLLQFGMMGSVYMNKIMGVASPRVGLINIGTEESKGLDLHREAYQKLSHAPIHFIGNVEARGLPMGYCDVAVCDGFTGNVVLKLIEGMAKFFSHQLKGMLMRSTKTKIAALMLKDGISAVSYTHLDVYKRQAGREQLDRKHDRTAEKGVWNAHKTASAA